MKATERAPAPMTLALAGMTALAVAMGIGRFAFTPLLPMMQIDAGLSVVSGGWLASANYFGTLVGALVAIVMRAPAGSAIRRGLVTIGLATLAMGFANHLLSWIVLRLLAGVATGWVLPFASAWALETLAPFRRPVLNSTVFAGFGVGIAAAGAVCLGLMQVTVRSGEAWIILGGLALAATALVWPVFGVARQASSGEGRGTEGGFPWDTDSVRLVICYGAFGFGYIIPATFLPVLARRAVEDPSIFGWAWPIFGAAAAGSTFAAVGFARLVGNRRLWGSGHVVMAVGVVMPVLRPGIIAIILSALLVGGTFTVITMAGFQEGRHVAGVHARRMIAAMASAFAVGQIAGPVSVSVVIRADGDFSAVLVLAGLVLTGSAWALFSRRCGTGDPRRERRLPRA